MKLNQQSNKTKLDRDDDDEDDFESAEKSLGYFASQHSFNNFVFTLDEPIKTPSYYRNTQNVLDNCKEGDRAEFKINSPGGMYSGLCTLLHALATTEATTVATLVGECASAASILALHCDHVQVGPFASMLCHNVRYGYVGKGNDVVSHVQHVTDVSTDLIKQTYEGFLSETEIEELLNGREIYLKSFEIIERLGNRESYREQLEALEEPFDTLPKPAEEELKPLRRKKQT